MSYGEKQKGLLASLKKKKKEKLISRIYNVMNKMTVLGNTNENRISKWQRGLKQILMKKYWNRWLILIESSIIGMKICYSTKHYLSLLFRLHCKNNPSVMQILFKNVPSIIIKQEHCSLHSSKAFDMVLSKEF